MTDAAYIDAIEDVFMRKPLRTVLMVDDKFPTYKNLVAGNASDFAQSALALALYSGFRDKSMLCDIENNVTKVDSETIRKSDLIVLDYHLGPNEGDTDRSVGLLCELAASKHFNTVVLYTAETLLDGAWLDIMCALIGTLPDKTDDLDTVQEELWQTLDADGRLPEPTSPLVRGYVERREKKDLKKEPFKAEHEAFTAEIRALGFTNATVIAERMLLRQVNAKAGDFACLKDELTTGACRGENRWIQSGNLFLAILAKKNPADLPDAANEVLTCLKNALIGWRPSFVQILISEIQNTFELDGLATESSYLRAPETRSALSYYLLNELVPLDLNAPAFESVRTPIIALVDRILEGIRHRLASDEKLLQLSEKALIGDLKDEKWDAMPKAGTSALFQRASDFARLPRAVDIDRVFFRLNNFLTTEPHRLGYATTGTILAFEENGVVAFCVVASPACDLVGREAGEEQAWTHQLSPDKAIVVVHLLPPDSGNGPLAHATNGQHVFIEHAGLERAFRIVDAVIKQPVYELMLVGNQGRVVSIGGARVLQATRLKKRVTDPAADAAASNSATELTPIDFTVVGQLRELNAMRVLQLTGQHLSRIGLDFVDRAK